jgi:hypothetical protein
VFVSFSAVVPFEKEKKTSKHDESVRFDDAPLHDGSVAARRLDVDMMDTLDTGFHLGGEVYFDTRADMQVTGDITAVLVTDVLKMFVEGTFEIIVLSDEQACGSSFNFSRGLGRLEIEEFGSILVGLDEFSKRCDAEKSEATYKLDAYLAEELIVKSLGLEVDVLIVNFTATHKLSRDLSAWNDMRWTGKVYGSGAIYVSEEANLPTLSLSSDSYLAANFSTEVEFQGGKLVHLGTDVNASVLLSYPESKTDADADESAGDDEEQSGDSNEKNQVATAYASASNATGKASNATGKAIPKLGDQENDDFVMLAGSASFAVPCDVGHQATVKGRALLKVGSIRLEMAAIATLYCGSIVDANDPLFSASIVSLGKQYLTDELVLESKGFVTHKERRLILIQLL